MMNGSLPRLLQSPGRWCGQIPAFLRVSRIRHRPIYQELCPGVLRSGGKPQETGRAPMTMSVANVAEDASPMRGLLPLWVGVLIYALFLVA